MNDMSATTLLDVKGQSTLLAAPSSVRVRILTRLDELDMLRPAWEELLSNYPQASIFSTWEWLAPWWRAFGEGQQLHVLAFENSSSCLVGLAPLYISTRDVAGKSWKVLRLMGDGSGDSDNLDIPVRSAYLRPVVEALLTYLQENATCWDLAHVNTLPADSLVGAVLPARLKDLAWPCLVYRRPRSVVHLPDRWEHYLTQLSSKERNKVGNLTRRLEKRYKARYYKCAAEADLTSCLEHLFRLHEMRWRLRGETGSFHSSARRKFYAEMASALLRRDRLQFWLLDLDGKTVAAIFGFRYGDTVYSLQEGFDPQFSSDSVGYVLRSHILREIIAEGVRRYDFLAGESSSKARWTAQVESYVNLHFARPWSIGSAYLELRQKLHGTKEWMRAHLPAPAWNLLHSVNAGMKRVSN
jgi:CelD/BcsL family acetyltransferase involved in cellulose biosynthesis